MRTINLILVLLLSAIGAAAQEVDQNGLYREPFLLVDPGMHTATIKSLNGDAAGRFLVTGSIDRTVRVWSAADGRLLRAIHVPTGPGHVGKIYAVAMSPDGETIAAGGWTEGDDFRASIYLFERATGRMTGRIHGLHQPVCQLAFSPDGRKIAATLGSFSGIHLFDARTLREIGTDANYNDTSCGLTFASDGRVATTSYDGKLRLYGPTLDNRQAVPAPDGKSPYGIAFSPDGGRIAVGYQDSPKVTVLDGRTLGKLYSADTSGVTNGHLGTIVWSVDGQTLSAGGQWETDHYRNVRSWRDGGRGAATDHPLAHDSIIGLIPYSDGRLAVAAEDPRVLMVNPSGSVAWQAEPLTADFRGQWEQLRVSSDGVRVRFGFERFGRSPAQFDLGRRRLETDAAPGTDLTVPSVAGLDIKDWQDSTKPMLTDPPLSAKPIILDPREISRSLAIAPDRRSFLLGTDWYLRLFDYTGEQLWRVPSPGAALAVNITLDGHLAIAAYGDGTIRWHRISDGAELLAFFPHRDGKRWVAWTPLGHYVASAGGEDLIRWQINKGLDQAPEVYSASRFRDQYYRPDVIARALDELDARKALAAADRDAGRQQTVVKSVAEDTTPRVTIIDPAEATFVDKPSLKVAYTIEDRPGTAIRRLRLLQDGRVISEARNLTIPTNGRLVGDLAATLQDGVPTLTLLAESDKGTSDPASTHLKRQVSDEDYKPALYVLAVGVNRFTDRSVPTLMFAAADAADFAVRLKQQEHGLYRRVMVRTLRNEEATGKAVLDGLEWLERTMTARDVAVIFLSTHGRNDARGSLFLFPYDVDNQDDLSLRRTGLKIGDLRESIAALADKGKVLVFLDACHSGNLASGARDGGQADIDKAASALGNADTGAIVFSSSTGKEFSVERADLGHGVFTYALLEAFDGKSNRPPPWLYVSDLEIWLSDRVNVLTRGA